MKKVKLLMPNFLKTDFPSFDFDFYEEKKVIASEELQQELLLVYGKKNTIILLDGKVIYKNFAGEVEVSFNKNNRFVLEYLRKQTTDFLLDENKKYLNSYIVLNVKPKQKKQKLNIILAATKQIYHVTILEAERENNLEIFEKYVGIDNAKINSVLEINAKDNCFIKYNAFYDIKSDFSQVFSQNLVAHKDANVNLNTINLSSANLMSLTYGQLIGQGANINLASCSFANKNNVLKNLILLEHKAKNTTSNIDNIGVVNDFANIEIDATGKILQGFSKSNAKQVNKFIALKDSAKVISNPQLIINEFDVQAGHSASVGGLDNEQIYYLQSRGLGKEKAKELLLNALAERFLSVYPASEKNKALDLIKKKIK
jgi:Fe-S cluster assembly protein SufD